MLARCVIHCGASATITSEGQVLRVNRWTVVSTGEGGATVVRGFQVWLSPYRLLRSNCVCVPNGSERIAPPTR